MNQHTNYPTNYQPSDIPDNVESLYDFGDPELLADYYLIP